MWEENPVLPFTVKLSWEVKTLAKKIAKESVIIEVQLAKNEYERLVKNASEKGFITLSEYIRNALRNA
jgi:predicted ABC-type ATPase